MKYIYFSGYFPGWITTGLLVLVEIYSWYIPTQIKPQCPLCGKQTRPLHIGLIHCVSLLNPYSTSDVKMFWEAVAEHVAVGEDRGLCRADVFRV